MYSPRRTGRKIKINKHPIPPYIDRTSVFAFIYVFDSELRPKSDFTLTPHPSKIRERVIPFTPYPYPNPVSKTGLSLTVNQQ